MSAGGAADPQMSAGGAADPQMSAGGAAAPQKSAGGAADPRGLATIVSPNMRISQRLRRVTCR